MLAPQGALYATRYPVAATFFVFSLSPCHWATTVAPNHYNMINATQGNSHDACNSRNQQANATIKQSIDVTRQYDNMYRLKRSLQMHTGFHTPAHNFRQ